MHDRIPDPCRLLIVGINPGTLSEEVDAPFAHPGNRFWPALEKAGITPYRVHASGGLSEKDSQILAQRGIGFTNLVARMTPRASDLTRDELVEGGERLEGVVDKHRPGAVMFAGVGAYRDAFGRRKARRGLQPEAIAGVPVWVVGNPSGLNAHETVGTLAASYREVLESTHPPQ
ncbi:mismatch-specific DNA-glycosylase [Corynebacterium sp. p3-SID1194]|uniref:mismatch-specific DNA-glycosylase n=1 Tax=Corynebacterium sp. p3-SID1194 TaxID=2916105 RepID=UPI0021A48CDF|nr:mismatch-specific DNA-glycosylase [Corynebacterium sp. p3-SID1194]MCT1449421.1 mismatch-specific DNA-glycosylase [Corynebacterium sp. p3-SID1194]